MKPQTSLLIASALKSVDGDIFWKQHLRHAQSDESITVHLAIMIEPFLSYVLDRSKSIESRFTKNRSAPYKKIKSGDIIFFKKSGGSVLALCIVAKVVFYDLNETPIEILRNKFQQQIRASDDFWELKKDAQYASLIFIRHVVKLPAIDFEKRGQQSWLIL